MRMKSDEVCFGSMTFCGCKLPSAIIGCTDVAPAWTTLLPSVVLPFACASMAGIVESITSHNRRCQKAKVDAVCTKESASD